MYCPPLKTTVPLLVWAISQRYNTSSKLSFILLKLFAWVNLFLCGFNVLIFLYFTEVNRTCSVDFIEIYFLLYGVINAQVYVRINTTIINIFPTISTRARAPAPNTVMINGVSILTPQLGQPKAKKLSRTPKPLALVSDPRSFCL